MKVIHFEKEDAEAFFEAMNEMYPYSKLSRPGDNGEIDYVPGYGSDIRAENPNARFGYFVPNDGYYLIVRK